ncbi:MAG: gluconeogenesis factor YvcK family protein [Patescibacteria group bacterium]
MCIGAGTGQSSILSALKGRCNSLSAIVAVTDNGGHSGHLRKIHKIPQVGDARKCLTALSGNVTLQSLFDFRYPNGHHRAGVSIGNLLLAKDTRKSGLGEALRNWGERMRCSGKVFPATEENTEIVAKTQNGCITGEWEIISRNPVMPIEHLSLSHDAIAYPPAVQAILDADVIIISPGSLHTGIISALLPKGIAEAIQKSLAPLIMVCNIMQQPGLTDGWDVSRHVSEIHRYCGRVPNCVIVNNESLPADILHLYESLGSQPVPLNQDDETYYLPYPLVPNPIDATVSRSGRYIQWPHVLTHCPKKLPAALSLAVSNLQASIAL